jgi:hypothetical protein
VVKKASLANPTERQQIPMMRNEQIRKIPREQNTISFIESNKYLVYRLLMTIKKIPSSKYINTETSKEIISSKKRTMKHKSLEEINHFSL